MNKLLLTLGISAFAVSSVFAQESKKPVNIMSAVQAESELMFNNAIERTGGVNRFDHGRLPATHETLN